MSIKILDKNKCSGCTACQQICPKNSIAMTTDEEGFLYPCVNEETCVECGLCQKACPVINSEKSTDIPNTTYVLQCNNPENLSACTSGGAVNTIAEEFIKDGGVVFGCILDEDFNPVHTMAETPQQLVKMRGSKYVQSNLEDSFSQVKQQLQHRKVLFIGTPCQVQGLLSFLQKPYDNLFTIDFVCRGVPSPMIWNKYKEFKAQKYNSPIVYANFREKLYGYNSSAITLKFANGKVSAGDNKVDYMTKSFFDGLISRPSCHQCSFKTAKRNSSLTVFDCWHFEALTGLADDNKGHTTAMVQDLKGEYLINSVKDKVQKVTVSTSDAIKLDGPMIFGYAPPHPKRSRYFSLINNQVPINKVVKAINPISKSRRIFAFSKKFLYKTKLLALIKKLK